MTAINPSRSAHQARETLPHAGFYPTNPLFLDPPTHPRISTRTARLEELREEDPLPLDQCDPPGGAERSGVGGTGRWGEGGGTGELQPQGTLRCGMLDAAQPGESSSMPL